MCMQPTGVCRLYEGESQTEGQGRAEIDTPVLPQLDRACFVQVEKSAGGSMEIEE